MVGNYLELKDSFDLLFIHPIELVWWGELEILLRGESDLSESNNELDEERLANSILRLLKNPPSSSSADSLMLSKLYFGFMSAVKFWPDPHLLEKDR